MTLDDFTEHLQNVLNTLQDLTDETYEDSREGLRTSASKLREVLESLDDMVRFLNTYPLNTGIPEGLEAVSAHYLTVSLKNQIKLLYGRALYLAKYREILAAGGNPRDLYVPTPGMSYQQLAYNTYSTHRAWTDVAADNNIRMDLRRLYVDKPVKLGKRLNDME